MVLYLAPLLGNCLSVPPGDTAVTPEIKLPVARCRGGSPLAGDAEAQDSEQQCAMYYTESCHA